MRRRSFITQLAAAGLTARLAPEANAQDDNIARSLFYRPEDGHVGDVIPFYDEGRFRIFYLHRFDDGTTATSWYQVSTEDFVHFTNHGEMLPRGTTSDQDLSVATGSVIKRDQQYHIFYTGYSSVFRQQGKPEQGVMHAVSDDLLKWRKIPAHTFFAPQDRYERDDWRDPFVFWNPEAHEYWMLIAARLKSGASKRRRGCTALCASKDLAKWEVREPFWAPSLYFTHECPDLFRMGDWYYFVFSEFSERMQTRYLMSRSIAGPWIVPNDDSFDGRALYAAKTASNGKKRCLCGWNPTRAGDKDYGKWEWGGNLVVHELVQESDGALKVKMPESIGTAFSNRLPLEARLALGKGEAGENGSSLIATASFAAATLGPMPNACEIKATIELTEPTEACGLMLHVQQDVDLCYYIRFEPMRNRLVFDMWPRPKVGAPGDVPFMLGLERPMMFTPGAPIEVKVLVDGTIGEIYVDDRIAMSTRMYDLKGGQCGIFVQQGAAHFRDIGLFTMGE